VNYKIGTAAAIFIAASACAGPAARTSGTEAAVATSMNVLPPPVRADLVDIERPYLIGPYDKLEIDVFGIEDLKREVQADASGRVSFPLAGTVEASGKTPAELADEIARRLRGRYVRDPQVTVNLKETVSQVVTVDGEVKQPGLYPVVGRMTLTRAVATAKGTTEFASHKNVYILREVEGQRMVGAYNLNSIRTGRYADPEIYANDVVVVGESRGRRVLQMLIGIGPAVLAPLVYVFR
jgi:polysaccharide biosynthesis/export protein